MPEISASSQLRLGDPVTNANFVITYADARISQETLDGYLDDGVFLIPLASGSSVRGVSRRERGVIITFYGTGAAGTTFTYQAFIGRYCYGKSTDDAETTKEIEISTAMTGGGLLANIPGSSTTSCIKSTEKCGSEITKTETTDFGVLESCFGSPGADVCAESGKIGRLIIPECFGSSFILIDTKASGSGGQASSCGVVYELID